MLFIITRNVALCEPCNHFQIIERRAEAYEVDSVTARRSSLQIAELKFVANIAM
jgi:hypothetical protein